jgi:RNA polymerase sigma factor (sigma-70 family)
MSTTLEDLARQAVSGDRDALDRLVRELQGDVCGLALRMLWNREDAEDATQEILVRVVTRLAQFDYRSRLRTWVYRIAVNCLLDIKKSPVEQMRLTFEQFAGDLAEGLSSDGPNEAERSMRSALPSSQPPIWRFARGCRRSKIPGGPSRSIAAANRASQRRISLAAWQNHWRRIVVTQVADPRGPHDVRTDVLERRWSLD